MRISHSVAGPRQGALEGAAQVVEGPRNDHVIVEAHQRGHAQHPDTDAWQRRQRLFIVSGDVMSTESVRAQTQRMADG